MGYLYIKRGECPICKGELEKDSITCPTNMVLPCYKCINCHAVFFLRADYDYLQKLAKSNLKELKSYIYSYERIKEGVPVFKETKSGKKKAAPENRVNGKKKIKETKSKRVKGIEAINELLTPKNLIENVSPEKNTYQKEEVQKCGNYKKGICLRTQEKCRPGLSRCSKYGQSANHVIKAQTEERLSKAMEVKDMPLPTTNSIIVIAISYNKKCSSNNHSVVDVMATCKAVEPNGKVVDLRFPSAYCADCKKYFVLKNDFIRVKGERKLLCIEEDHTSKNTYKPAKTFYGTESLIHRLGYNVIEGNKETAAQRRMCLANIMENTSISKHEIMSLILKNIKIHQGQERYQKAVKKWREDLEFVRSYKLGDCPEVAIKKIVVR